MKTRHGTRKKNKSSYFSLRNYILTLLLFSIIGGIPGILYASNAQNWQDVLISGYTGWYLLYWVIFSAIFSAFAAFRRYRDFDKPIKQLSQAANQVANGDFSVYLPAIHDAEHYDYLDILFEDFNLMVSELGSTETLKSNFISNVSHEFKAPLAVIQGYANSLNDDSLSVKERQKYLRAIVEATNNLASLVTNILRLNKLENQNMPTKLSYFDLSRQLADCALQLEPNWEKKEIDFQADLLDHCPILADEDMLAIVWNNLLNNAIKFTPEKGKVSLIQKKQDQGVLISVVDSGIGMESSVIDHVFEQFYQGETSHSNSGNGLGLAMAKKIISLSNGTISVQSKVNLGTTFSV